MNGAPHPREAPSRKPQGGVRAEQTRGTEAAATLASFEPRASESEARSTRPHEERLLPSLPGSRFRRNVIVSRGPIELFPAHCHLSCALLPVLAEGNKPPGPRHPTPPGAQARPREMRPEAHSPGNPGPSPPAPTFRESKDQNPQKSCEPSGYTPYTHRARHQSPTFIGGKRENIQKAGAGGCFIDFSLFPSPGARWTVGRGSERAISLSRPLRAAGNRGRRWAGPWSRVLAGSPEAPRAEEQDRTGLGGS